MEDAYLGLLKRLCELGGKILDAGCGDAVTSQKIGNVILLDNQISALNRIEGERVLGDALQLPFKDGSFDLVWSGGLNEHFSGLERQKVFDEMIRVSRKWVVVIVPNRLSIVYWVWRVCLKLRKRWVYGYENPYSIFELKRRMNIERMGGTFFPVRIFGNSSVKLDGLLGSLGGLFGYYIGVGGIVKGRTGT